VILVIDAAEKKDPSEWFGFWSMETGNWAYNDTKFSKAVKTPDSLIIIKNFDSMSSYVANRMMSLFEGCQIYISLGYDRTSLDSFTCKVGVGGPWFYSCEDGVKFWLLGTSKTNVAWKDHLIGNPRIEHME